MSNSRCVIAIFFVTVGICTRAVHSQSQDVRLQIQSEGVGLLGQVRGGTWAPLLLKLENPSTRSYRMRCQWLVPDADRDQVHAQRIITLGPQRDHRAWLYAMAPLATGVHDKWLVRIIDEDRKKTVATRAVRPLRLLGKHVRVVGITGSSAVGLEPYTLSATQHEPCQLLRGIEPAWLPDRWYGLSLMQALVWTPDGGDPGSGAISTGTCQAIHQWVQRGGHLVVVLESVGNPWPQSPLGILWPPVKVGQVQTVDAPDWLGRPTGERRARVHMRVIEPTGPNAPYVSVLLRDQSKRPVVVAWPHGFGRVTLIGVNLADPALTQAGLPNGVGLWSKVFGWRAPAYTKSYVDQEVKARRMTGSVFRQRVVLDRFIPRLIAMRDTATPALLAAMIVFGVYWLLAGPVSFALLKRWGKTHHGWTVFVGLVLTFSVLTWSSAWLLRSQRSMISHFTVLDAVTGSGWGHARSWLSLFVPKHGLVDIALDRQQGSTKGDTLASPGFGTRASGFLDPQQYLIHAASPNRATMPIRATAKQLELSHMRRLVEPRDAWIVSKGRLHVVDGRLRGVLEHRLPRELENVLVVYCPGGSQTPWVWRRRGPWMVNQPWQLQQPASAERLVGRNDHDSLAVDQGYLGRLIAFKTGGRWATQETGPTAIASSEIVQAIEMLSFYGLLPPPDYRNTNPMNRVVNYDRHLARSLDLTTLTSFHCVMLIGHMERAPLPVPLTVDGRPVDADGWTVVRWIGWLDAPPVPAVVASGSSREDRAPSWGSRHDFGRNATFSRGSWP